MIAVRPPDVLVIDLAMPKLDGFGVLDRLLERAETRQIPVVVLTGRELTGAERRLLQGAQRVGAGEAQVLGGPAALARPPGARPGRAGPAPLTRAA